MSSEKPRRLGRGLEALIGGANSASARTSAPAPEGASDGNELRQIPLTRIRPNPFQPRREFAESELTELRTSLAASGLLQPVIVRQAGDGFELISGERRYRAAGQLGWERIPALVRNADEQTMLTLALIENLQRADLNVVEEARGYHRLHDEFQLTHQQIAEAVGKDRSTVSNLLRLLTLPDDVQHFLEHSKLTMGHARALLGISDQTAIVALAKEIVASELSVRETERRVRQLGSSRQEPKPGTSKPLSAPATASSDPAVRQVVDTLRKRFQTDVRLQLDAQNKGTIQLSFYSLDDLQRLLDLLTKQPEIGD